MANNFMPVKWQGLEIEEPLLDNLNTALLTMSQAQLIGNRTLELVYDSARENENLALLLFRLQECTTGSILIYEVESRSAQSNTPEKQSFCYINLGTWQQKTAQSKASEYTRTHGAAFFKLDPFSLVDNESVSSYLTAPSSVSIQGRARIAANAPQNTTKAKIMPFFSHTIGTDSDRRLRLTASGLVAVNGPCTRLEVWRIGGDANVLRGVLQQRTTQTRNTGQRSTPKFQPAQPITADGESNSMRSHRLLAVRLERQYDSIDVTRNTILQNSPSMLSPDTAAPIETSDFQYPSQETARRDEAFSNNNNILGSLVHEENYSANKQQIAENNSPIIFAASPKISQEIKRITKLSPQVLPSNNSERQNYSEISRVSQKPLSATQRIQELKRIHQLERQPTSAVVTDIQVLSHNLSAGKPAQSEIAQVPPLRSRALTTTTDSQYHYRKSTASSGRVPPAELNFNSLHAPVVLQLPPQLQNTNNLEFETVTSQEGNTDSPRISQMLNDQRAQRQSRYLGIVFETNLNSPREVPLEFVSQQKMVQHMNINSQAQQNNSNKQNTVDIGPVTHSGIQEKKSSLKRSSGLIKDFAELQSPSAAKSASQNTTSSKNPFSQDGKF